MATPIKKGKVYGDFTPIGRKTLPSGGSKYRCVCVRCDRPRTYAETTLKAKPSCPRCNKAKNKASVDSGELPERILSELSVFKRGREELEAMLDDIPDGPDTAIEKLSIKMLVDLIPEAEAAYRENPSQSLAYALNSFLTNIRELRQDLDERATQKDIVSDIMVHVMQPKFQEIGRIVIDAHYSMKSQMSQFVERKRRARMKRDIDQVTRDIGSKLEAVYSDMEKALAGKVK